MKWKKLGLIFCPDHHAEWMVSHAAVPFAEHIAGDNFRIYFSTRDAKNRSHTAFIEIDITNPQKILKISDTPILAPGELGAFDDSGSMLSWLVKPTSSQNRYLYYSGWNLGVTVPFRIALGLAISQDGESFARFAKGPILDRGPQEPHFIASCCVLIEEGIWRMWYVSCVGWKLIDQSPRHYYHIKYASSNDGIQWHPDGTVAIDFESDEEYAFSRPSVIRDGNLYKMWYSYRGGAYRMGYSESTNGIQWERLDKSVGIDVSDSGWDSQMIAYPFVFDHKEHRYMLYNGNGYGKAGFGLAIWVNE
jgi:hypothetical protein